MPSLRSRNRAFMPRITGRDFMQITSRGSLITAAALAALFATSANAQQAQAQGAQPSLQEVVVTGSLIKRTDTETPSPVQVITAQDLTNSGYTNVNDVLRNL